MPYDTEMWQCFRAVDAETFCSDFIRKKRHVCTTHYSPSKLIIIQIKSILARKLLNEPLARVFGKVFEKQSFFLYKYLIQE